MPVFPSTEAVLLEISQCLGVLNSEAQKLKSDDKIDFADCGLSEDKQRSIGERLVADILSVFDLDPESEVYLLKQFLDWSNFQKGLELNTWTHDASERQIAWYVIGRSIVPTLGRLLAYWDLDDALGRGMPAGEFWFLPSVDTTSGQVKLPLPKVLDWLIDLFGTPSTQFQLALGGEATRRLDLYGSRLRTLQNWKSGRLPHPQTICDMFPDDMESSTSDVFCGAFIPEQGCAEDQLFERALEFVRRKELTPQALARQIAFPDANRLSEVLSNNGSAFEREKFLCSLVGRYAVPTPRVIRQRLLVARGIQDGYQRLVKFLCPGVEVFCTDPARNKVLQLIGTFTRVFNLTIQAHKNAAGSGEAVEDGIFDELMTPYERDDLLLSVVPRLRSDVYRILAKQWSLRFEKMRPMDELEDFWPTDPALVGKFSGDAIARLLQETEEEQRVMATVERMRTASPWRLLQAESFDVVRRLINIDRVSMQAKQLACERLTNLASTPVERGEAAVQLALNILSRPNNLRPQDAEQQVERLLNQARVVLGRGHREPLLLQAEAKHLLFQGDRKESLALYRGALASCSQWGCGMLRGEIARDIWAIEVADGSLIKGNHQKYYRNMVAFGMFSNGLQSFEDTAISVHDFFWSDLFQPYKGAKPFKRPQVVKAQADLIELLGSIVKDPPEEVTAWLMRHRKRLERARLADVRGDSVLTWLVKGLANFKGIGLMPREVEARYREVIEELINSWSGQVNLTDFKGQTPLMLAADEGEDQVVRCLLGQGADIDAQDYLGRTALHAAITASNLLCVSLILECNPEVANKVTLGESQSVLHTAVRMGDVAIVRLIVEAFPSLCDQANDYGRTPDEERNHIIDSHANFSSFMRKNNRIPPSILSLQAMAGLLGDRI